MHVALQGKRIEELTPPQKCAVHFVEFGFITYDFRSANKPIPLVIPAHAGIQSRCECRKKSLDTGLRRYDGEEKHWRLSTSSRVNLLL